MKKVLKHILIILSSVFFIIIMVLIFRMIAISYEFNKEKPAHSMYFEGKIYGDYLEIIDAGNYWASYFDSHGTRIRHEEITENIFNKFYIEFEEGETFVQVEVTPHGEQQYGSNTMTVRQLSPLFVYIDDVKQQQVKFVLNVYQVEN